MTKSKNVVDLRKRRRLEASKPLSFAFSPRKKQRDSLRARRRRARSIAVASVLVALLALAGGVSYAAHLPAFTVQKFAVRGATHMGMGEIEAFATRARHDDAFHFFPPDNIFLYHPKELESEIVDNFPRIQSAQVRRETLLATTVNINVKERDAFAQWCRGGNAETATSSSTPQECYLLDDAGFIFAKAGADESVATSYVFEGGVASSTDASPVGSHFAPSHMTGILALLQIFKERGFTPQGAVVESDADFVIPLQEGFFVKASFGASAEDLMRNLALVLTSESLEGKQNEIEYIDLRFGNKVYFKLKSDSAEPL